MSVWIQGRKLLRLRYNAWVSTRILWSTTWLQLPSRMERTLLFNTWVEILNPFKALILLLLNSFLFFKRQYGTFCSFPFFFFTASCSEGCDLDHGWCRRPDECRCKVGWMGTNCTECVPYPGCAHGTCSEPWTCNCDPGYGGITCEEKLDFCEKMESNPCQNGGTCLSVEQAEGGFVCHCPPSHEGHYCEKIKNWHHQNGTFFSINFLVWKNNVIRSCQIGIRSCKVSSHREE